MGWIKEIGKQEQKIKYSQNGEEYRLEYIFENIGTTNKVFVDIGAWNGEHLSNTKLFREKGWLGVLIDGNRYPGIYHSFVTQENIIETFSKFFVPKEFDLLSIDIDGNDYWILKEILRHHRPRVIVSEFNSEFPPTESKTIAYNPNFVFGYHHGKPDDYYGYTYGAGQKLARAFGYTIVYQQSDLNLFYLRNDLVIEEPEFEVKEYRHWNVKSDKIWIEI
jgi:hypothetical protein